VARAATESFAKAVEQGHGDKDMSAVFHASAE
jgi:3-hydroxyisobutyrate dehydrogenase-like beta-hydroxyacid dehydrogenase